MNKFTTSILATLMLSTSLSALADDSMKGMDMSKMPMMDKAAGSSMHGMDMGDMKMKSPTGGKVAHGVGVIKSIDAKADMIALNHQAIKELNWPPMSMGFKVADSKLLDGLKVGQKVTFELKAEGTKEIVTAIAAAK